MPTIFSRIIAGEIPSYKVAEDDKFFAFLDINPMAKGHTLVVPKQEIDYIFDLDDNTFIDMIIFVKKQLKPSKSHPVQTRKMMVIGLSASCTFISFLFKKAIWSGRPRLKLSEQGSK